MSFFRPLTTKGATTDNPSDIAVKILDTVKVDLPKSYNGMRNEAINELTGERYFSETRNKKLSDNELEKDPKYKPIYENLEKLIIKEYAPTLKKCLSEVFNTPELQKAYQMKTTPEQRSQFRAAIASYILTNYITFEYGPLSTKVGFGGGQISDGTARDVKPVTKAFDDNLKNEVINLAEKHLMIDVQPPKPTVSNP